ncbi:DUF3592 domain-containing protein [Streptomyces sp. NPDC098781]|uniref:DUF3592 domain-containing protein n=1 Tax=Streptomyces sp. NPDC098781 TaxID=3366097 RepID=UPI003821C3DF
MAVLDLGGLMEALFYLLPLVIMALAVFSVVKLIRRAREVRGAWNSGLTAEARCMRAYAMTRNDNTRLHHVYEFTAHDGRTVRFEEKDGPATRVEGDFVTVFYVAQQPERATVRPPAPGVLGAIAGGALAANFAIIVFCLFFVTVAHWGLSGAS